jgi:hypothetical protein
MVIETSAAAAAAGKPTFGLLDQPVISSQLILRAQTNAHGA